MKFVPWAFFLILLIGLPYASAISIEEENTSLKSQIIELEAEIEGLKEENTSLISSNEILQSQIWVLKHQYDELESAYYSKLSKIIPREVTYFFLLTTIIFISTTFYFARKDKH